MKATGMGTIAIVNGHSLPLRWSAKRHVCPGKLQKKHRERLLVCARVFSLRVPGIRGAWQVCFCLVRNGRPRFCCDPRQSREESCLRGAPAFRNGKPRFLSRRHCQDGEIHWKPKKVETFPPQRTVAGQRCCCTYCSSFMVKDCKPSGSLKSGGWGKWAAFFQSIGRRPPGRFSRPGTTPTRQPGQVNDAQVLDWVCQTKDREVERLRPFTAL